MFVAVVASVLAAIVAWICWSYTRSRLAYDVHKIPGPRAWPIVGNLGDLAGSSHLHKIFAGWAEQYGPIFRCQLGHKSMLVISDPTATLKLCSKEANIPKWAPAYSQLNTRRPHLNILGTDNHEEWRSIRKVLNPAFSPENIRKLFPRIYETVLQAVDVIQQLSTQGPVDMNDLSKRITADVIAGFSFEEEMGCLKLEQGSSGNKSLVRIRELEAITTMLTSISMLFINPLYAAYLALNPWHPLMSAYKKAKARFEAFEDQKVANIRKQGVQPESNTHVWACLSRLVDYKDGSPLCDEGLAAQVAVMFAAGFETTAHTITWALFELAGDQKLQETVREELRHARLAPTADGSEPRPLDYSDLSKLPWVDAVARETLRLHATAPFGTFREAKEDMVVMGYRVPKGTPFMLGPYAMHTSSHNWVQPYKFLPARWLDSKSAETVPTDKGAFPDATLKGNRHALAASWSPFASGPRNCIGQSLAMAELRAVLAVLLSHFRFAYTDDMHREKFLQTEQVAWITLQPRGGLPLKVTPL